MLLYDDGTPWTFFGGIEDKPRAGVAPAVFQASPHTVFSMIKAPWGELNTPIAFASGAEMTTHLGDDVFTVTNPHYNYQTVLAQWLGKAGTPQYAARMELPGMARSNGRMFMEVCPNTFPVYERGIGGDFRLDGNGDRIPTGGYVDGHLVRFITKTNVDDFALGNGKPLDPAGLVGKLIDRDGDGNIINPLSPTFQDSPSVMYPIFDYQGKWMGELGDRLLTEIFTPRSTSRIPGKTQTIESTGQMMYRLSHFIKAAKGGGANQMYGVAGDKFIDFSLKPDSVNESGTPVYFDDVYVSKYALKEQRHTGKNVHEYMDFRLYDDNIATILEMMHTAEVNAKAMDVNYPCWIDEDDKYSINLFDGHDHRDVPYSAIELVGIATQPTAGYHAPFQDSRFKMAGGNDGDTSDATYNQVVTQYCKNVRAMFPIWDTMQYQLGWTYDLGYEVETKKALYSLMGNHNSLIVVTSLEEFGKDLKYYDDAVSTAIALEAAYGLYPESSIYKTAPTRGIIVPYAVKVRNHAYRKPIPLTFSLAKKFNDFFGIATKKWDASKNPLDLRNKLIDETLLNFVSLDLPQRRNFWNTQMVIVESIHHEVRGFTGIQTIHDNDSSVLNSGLVLAACGHAIRAGEEAAVAHRGRSAPPSVIARDHEELIRKICSGIDPSVATVDVSSFQTPDDYNAGYAITDRIVVSGNNGITVATLELVSQYAEEE